MRLVSVNSLKPGDELARPVFTASGKIILNSGVVLKENYIEKFKELGINRVYIDDARNDVVKVLKSAYTKIHNSEEIDEFAIKDAARKIVDYAREYRDRGIKCGDTFNQLCDRGGEAGTC